MVEVYKRLFDHSGPDRLLVATVAIAKAAGRILGRDRSIGRSSATEDGR